MDKNKEQHDASVLLSQLRLDKDVMDHEKSSQKRPALVFAIVMIAASVLLYFKAAKSDDTSSYAEPVAKQSFKPEITENHSLTGEAKSELTASGYILATRQATVSSETTGRLTEILVIEGQRVRKGDLIARLDSRLLEAQLELAKSRLEARQSKLDQTHVLLREAEANLARFEKLSIKKLSSEEQLDKAKFAVHSLKARIESEYLDIVVDEKQVAIQEEMLSNTNIYAPFSGVVVEQAAQVGEIVSPISAGGGFTRTGICTLVDTQSLEGEIYVNERFIQRIHSDQPVLITSHAYPELSVKGFVRAIMPSVNKETATVKVKVGLYNHDERILPNMGIDVAFEVTKG